MWKLSTDICIAMDSPVAGYENNAPGTNKAIPLFIIRAKFNGGVHPGKLVYGFGAHIPWGGAEHVCREFEVYVGPVKWVHVKGHDIPKNAIQAGNEADGKPLYVARAKFPNGLFVGKAGAHLRKGGSISYQGKEWDVDDYEVLIAG
ncbi:DUF3421 domain-containing protein [Enterobacter cloacae]|uniref:DUF3421 domain-containing protein n=1 Tax=Enterobacter cloacae TaxID=550 RepID=UPI0005F8BA4C|nr:DUF3421 domain-containing protein [Enterobacter cloacae]EGS1684840.1 DUF3421 domain-containing protein [Enterobacter cloacae]EKK5414345.1 DUF3421 domain-containing protein [Enterobacter cloacae]EKX4144464.1 DUF3421 domain-containing protein [Enterobacter cloacae]KJX06235.1 hypothetical protein SG72_20300 [Enterobacter cloacae subsp. cloacae]MBW4214649.1 DUF3421 domain-containing protein [Enterobacter cloacae subsp. cloacae]